MTRKFFSSVLYLIAFLFIFSAVLITVFSYLLKDLKHYTELTFELVEKKTGYNISIDDINWSLSRGAGVEIDNLRITDTGRQALLLSSNKVYILIQLPPLLKKHLLVSRIILTDPQLSVSRGEDGNWVFFTFPAVKFDDLNRYGKYFDFSTSLRKFQIKNGKLLFRDSFSHVTADFENIDLQVNLNRWAKTYHLSAYAEQKTNGNTGTFSIEGDFSSFSPDVIYEYLLASGHLSLKSMPLSTFMPYIKHLAPIPDTEAFFDANLVFRLHPQYNFEAEGSIESDRLLVSIQDRKPVSFGPWLFSFNIKGSPDSLLFDRLALSLPEAIKMDGTLSLTKLRQESPRFVLKLDSNQFNITAFHKYMDAVDIPAGPVRNILLNISEGEMSLKNILYQGRLKGLFSERRPALQAELKIKDTILLMAEHLPPLQIVDSAFEIDNDTITGGLTAHWLSGDTCTVGAAVTSLFKKPRLNITVHETLPARSLNEIMTVMTDNSSLAKILQTFSGTITSRTNISFDNRLHVKSEIDLTMASYCLGDAVTKPAGLSNKLYLNSSMAEKQTRPPFSFDFFMDDHLTVSGRVYPGSSPSAEGSYELKALDLSSFELPSLNPFLQHRGLLTGRGAFCFPPSSSELFPIQGSFTIDGFEIAEQGSESPLVSISLEAGLDGQRTFVKKASVKVGETYFTVSGTLEELLPPRGNLMADAGFFDIDDFVDTVGVMRKALNKKEPKAPPEKPNIFRRTLLDIDLKITKLNFLKWNADNATSQYAYKNGTMLWDDINLKANSGNLNGSVLYDFSVPGKWRLDLRPTRTSVDFLWFIPGLREGQAVTGTMNMAGIFSSTYKKKKEIVPNMTGDFHVTVSDGKINKLTVLSKILTLLNIKRILQLKVPDLLSQGMPFDSIEGAFVMNKGLMETNNLTLKSPAMNFTAVGTVDVSKGEMDFTAGAQILPTISKILGNIPVAGNILIGKDKSLTIGYFDIKGPYKNPSVKPLPIRSLSRKVVEIFKVIIDIPRDIISPQRKKGPDQDNAT